MLPVSSASPSILSLLLLPQHVIVNTSTLPLLTRLQTLLNKSYTATYCAFPSIFGTEHLRLADPAQLADIIGQDGFTIALLLVKERDEEGNHVVEVVATGSVKNFGNGDVKQYAHWSKNISGTQWMAMANESGNDSEPKVSRPDGTDDGQEDVRWEVTAFAVSPSHQGKGLGAHVLSDIEWLVSRYAYSAGSNPRWTHVEDAPSIKGVVLPSTSSEQLYHIEGIDLDKLKLSHQQRPLDSHKLTDVASDGGVGTNKTPKLVLIGIRELGIETYYERRGYKSVWAGLVPIGMWDCREECTMVYMEKELLS